MPMILFDLQEGLFELLDSETVKLNLEPKGRSIKAVGAHPGLKVARYQGPVNGAASERAAPGEEIARGISGPGSKFFQATGKFVPLLFKSGNLVS